ncbi:MAG: DUF1039 domain-containing protein [Enterobacteriaceae bacterium]
MTGADKKLLVSVAVAAANNGMAAQAYDVMALFPQLIVDEEDRHICQAVIYFVLHQLDKALSELAQCESESARTLRLLMKEKGTLMRPPQSRH